MRMLVPTAVLVALGLAAIASSRPSAQGQTLQAGITVGEKLSISFEANGAGRPCTVIGVRGDFIGCRIESHTIESPATATEQWYNLRLVARIDKTTVQQ